MKKSAVVVILLSLILLTLSTSGCLEKSCEKCYGTGSDTCPVCDGIGGGPGKCEWCGGSGHYAGGESCWSCNGTGVCRTCGGAGGRTCTRCYGSGEYAGETCTYCGGDGWQECRCTLGCGLCRGEGIIKCRYCDGDGHVFAVENLCWSAAIIGGIIIAVWFALSVGRGRGRELTPGEIKAIYHYHGLDRPRMGDRKFGRR